MHLADFIHPALDCGRIDLAVERLNDYRISHGLSSLGFLNAFLYSKGATGLVDIVVRVSSPVQRRRALCLRDSPCRVTGRNEPWLWYWWFHRDCWVGSGEYMLHRLSRPDCHVDAVAGVVHCTGLGTLDSGKLQTLVLQENRSAITAYIEPRAMTVV